MKLHRFATFALPVLLLTLAFATSAWAEDEEGQPDDLKKRIQKKMENILELMQKNESALLKLSAGEKATPKKIDLEVPEEGASGAAGGSEGASSGSSAGESGEDIAEKLEELIRTKGGRIPDELKQLVEMIPLWSSCSSQFGSESKDPKNQKQGEQQQGSQSDPRDARKQMGEQNRKNKKQGQDEPSNGEKSPTDPAKRLPKGGQPDDPGAEQPKRADDIPAWAAALPPEIRDAMAGGRAEEVPARYRHLIRRYLLWIQKNR